MADHPLYLAESDVWALVDIGDAIRALEEAFSAADVATCNMPRQRVAVRGRGTFHLMGAAYGPAGVLGSKAYFATPAGTAYHVLLYSSQEPRLLAIIEANLLGQLRTGAASGLATKLLANPNASRLGVIGTGKQASAQIAAVCAIRPIEQVRVFGRSVERREAFAQSMASELGIEVAGASSAEECVAGAHIVVTITKSSEPVCRSEWIADGTHINAAGANAANRRELDEALVRRAAVRVTDDVAQARIEAAEFRDLAARCRLDWSEVCTLSDLLQGRLSGRATASDVTIFKSLGIALEDVAFAQIIYQRALERGRGRDIAAE